MFSTPLGLLALLGLPAIVGLHLYRRRFQPRVTSALFLWGVEDRTPATGRRRQPLHRSASLWLELLGALLLALFLAGFDPFGRRDAEHFVAVLDGSTSMLAQGKEDRSAAELARDEVRQRLRRLSGSDRVTLIQSGTPPRLLCGPAAPKGQALAALERYSPQRTQAGRDSSLALALEVTGGQGRVLWVTDHHRPDEVADEVEALSLGSPADNWALSQVRRRRFAPDVDRVSFTVASYADRPRTVRVELRAFEAGTLLAERSLSLQPDDRETISLELPANSPTLELALNSDEHSIDDVARLAPLPERELLLYSELSSEQAWLLGLGRPGAELPEGWRELVGEARFAEQLDSADLILGWGIAASNSGLTAPPAGGLAGLGSRLILRPPAREARTWIGPFLVERAHPLLEGVNLDGVAWNGDPERQARGVTLAAAGPASLITERLIRGRRSFELNIDPERSTLWRSPDWPILLANWASMVRAELPGARETNLSSGDALTWIDDGTRELRIRGPQVDQVVRGGRNQAIDVFDQPGLYVLERDGGAPIEVAVNALSPAESELRGRNGGLRESTGSSGTTTARRGPMTLALLALAVGAWLLDAFALHRAKHIRGTAA